MFCEVISSIIAAFFPINLNFFVCTPIAEPIETHIPCLGAFLLDVGVNKRVGSGVICFEQGGRPGVIKGLECAADDNGSLAVSKQPSSVCFRSRSNHFADCFAFRVDWSVTWWGEFGRVRDTIAQVEMASKATPGIGEDKVRSV